MQKEKLSLLDKFEAISSHLAPRKTKLSRPTLWHWDIRPPNMFVINGQITSIIDWQDAWIGPFFLQARRPPIVDHHGDLMLRLPEGYEDIADRDEKARITKQVESSILLWCHENETKVQNPELHELLSLPQFHRRQKTVAFASELSDGDVTPLRGCLIDFLRYVTLLTSMVPDVRTLLNINSHWSELDTGIECPIQFSASEVMTHDEEAKKWNENADFWSSLEGFVSRDGWTSLENYHDALRFFEELRENGLEQLSGADLVDFELRSRWADRGADE